MKVKCLGGIEILVVLVFVYYFILYLFLPISNTNPGMLKKSLLLVSFLFIIYGLFAQEDSASVSTATAVDAALKQDSLSKFDSFNKKMEKLFTWCQDWCLI